MESKGKREAPSPQYKAEFVVGENIIPKFRAGTPSINQVRGAHQASYLVPTSPLSGQGQVAGELAAKDEDIAVRDRWRKIVVAYRDMAAMAHKQYSDPSFRLWHLVSLYPGTGSFGLALALPFSGVKGLGGCNSARNFPLQSSPGPNQRGQYSCCDLIGIHPKAPHATIPF